MSMHILLNLLQILFDYNLNFPLLLSVSTVCITYMYVYLLLLKNRVIEAAKVTQKSLLKVYIK